MAVPRWQKTLVAGLGSLAVLAATLVGGPAAAVSDGSAAGNDLGYVAKLSNAAGTCTGVLINPSWVLTAGGCFGTAAIAVNGTPPLATTVVVGRSNLGTSAGSAVRATRVVPHPTRDLALVGLSEPVAGITAATLSKTAPAADQALTISGFGRTAKEWVPKQLQTGTFVVTATEDQSVRIEGTGTTPSALCRGDAGAPAVRVGGAVTEVVGLGSTSRQGGCLWEPRTTSDAVLSRVDGLSSWITASTESSGYVPLASMSRVFDSRNAVGITTKTALVAEKEYVFQVLGVGGIPTSNVSGVMLDLSVHDQSTYTQTKLWADGTTQPSLQGLVHNKAGVEPLGNAAVIPVGTNGKMRLWHAAGTAHVVVDVQGYFLKSATVPTAGGYVPITQTRVVDTRSNVGTTGGAIPANGTRTVTLTGNGVPSGTETVFASVVLFGSTEDGYLRLLPGSGVSTGTGGPDVSFPRRTFSAGTTIKLSGNKVTINNRSDAAVEVAIDVQGYFSQNVTVGGGYREAAGRVLDTRSTLPLAATTTVDFRVTGVGGIPATGVTAVVMNIHTQKSGTAGNAMTMWPTGSNPVSPGPVHYQPGNNATTGSINRTSLAIIPVGTDGKISIRNTSATETDVYIELEGWFQDQPRP